MAAKGRPHWFWRGTIAATIGLAVHFVCAGFAHTGYPGDSLFLHMFGRLQQSMTDDWAFGVVSTVFYGIPAMAAALAAYGFLTRTGAGRQPDRELHCRRCHHILRGLSEPRCPECGEAI